MESADSRKRKKKELLSTPVNQIAIEEDMRVDDLVEQMAGMSIQARNLGLCALIYEKMLTDEKRPTVFLGLSGPLIAAGLRRVIRDMIEKNLVDVVVSTGAILYQDFYQALGGDHYTGSPDMDDVLLRDLYIDRIYDTLVDEEKFGETDRYIGELALSLEPRGYSSREFLDFLGSQVDDPDSILATAHRHGIPVFSPALNDSSIGIGLTYAYARQKKNRSEKNISGGGGSGGEKFYIDPIRDNYELTQIIINSRSTGAVYIGGGTPKNYINDAVVMANYGLEREVEGHEYAIQITTATPLDGGLSGSTLGEAQSWGKIYREAKKAMAFVEASIGLPLIAGYLFGRRVGENRTRLRFVWDGDALVSMEPYR